MAANIQDSVEYYILRQNRLYGPLSRAKIGFAIARKIFSDDDKISSDQLNWIPLKDFNQSIKSASPRIAVSLSKNQAGVNPAPQGIRLTPIADTDPDSDSDEFLPDDTQEAPASSSRIHIVFAIVAVLLLAGIGVGLYFTYDYIFNGSSVSSTDVTEVNEIMTLLAKKNEGKITRKEFWQEAKRLAQEHNPLVGWLIFREVIGSSDDDIKFDKNQREKIFEMLGSGDEWATLVKIIGENVYVTNFIRSLPLSYAAREKAQNLYKTENENAKRYISVPLEKLDYARLSRLISETRDTNLLSAICRQMRAPKEAWKLKRIVDKSSTNPSNEIVHEVAKRFTALNLLPLSYLVDQEYFEKGSHDYNTVTKKFDEELSESKAFKLETMDFKGFGFFIIERGTLYYRHIRGDKPYRVKIDGELWRNLNKKFVLLKKNPGFSYASEEQNLKMFHYNGATYLMPQKTGPVSAEIRIFKNLEQE